MTKPADVNAAVNKDDGRSKVCDVCFKPFRDKSRNKATKRCSPECTKAGKNAQKRDKYKVENPPQPTLVDIHYHNSGEYPYWTDMRVMRNHFWEHNPPFALDKLETIDAAKQRDDHMGGKKTQKAHIPYDGREDGAYKVSVEFAKHEHTKASPVVSFKMTAEEREAQYSDKHLRDERMRTKIFFGEKGAKDDYRR